uniref:Uncharacterized protein n=1 Tax=Rhizophora mucronata TaxID=61149 RepID=A0A2P2Q833_RHIMU
MSNNKAWTKILLILMGLTWPT